MPSDENTKRPRSDADQVHYWNHVAGPAWVEEQERLDRQLRPLGRRAMDEAQIARGERVLDVGCGCGDTTLELARRVGADGRVTGLDLSRRMLGRARARAEEAGARHAAFVAGDAGFPPLPVGRHDVLFSRFGVMFFRDPAAAFANLARTLRAGGRVAFVCWQGRERNPWVTVPVRAAAAHVAMPPPPPGDAPGEFGLSDPARIRELLGGAGLSDVEVCGWDLELAPGGGDPEEAARFYLRVGPIAAALREAGGGPELERRVAEAVREALLAYHTPQGVRLGAVTWLVCARRPASGREA